MTKILIKGKDTDAGFSGFLGMGFCGITHRFFCWHGMGKGIEIQSPRSCKTTDIVFCWILTSFATLSYSKKRTHADCVKHL